MLSSAGLLAAVLAAPPEWAVRDRFAPVPHHNMFNAKFHRTLKNETNYLNTSLFQGDPHVGVDEWLAHIDSALQNPSAVLFLSDSINCTACKNMTSLFQAVAERGYDAGVSFYTIQVNSDVHEITEAFNVGGLHQKRLADPSKAPLPAIKYFSGGRDKHTANMNYTWQLTMKETPEEAIQNIETFVHNSHVIAEEDIAEALYTQEMEEFAKLREQRSKH